MIPADRTARAVRDSLDRAKLVDDYAQALAAQLAIDYYEDVDAQERDLNDTYEPLYDTESDWPNEPKTCVNMTAAIVDGLSTLYHEPIRRKWNDMRWEKAWSAMRGFESAMQDVDRYTLLSGLMAVRPIPLEGGGVRWALYTRPMVKVIPSPTDPVTPLSVELSWRESSGEERKHFWTATDFIDTLNDVQVNSAREQDHGLGLIPLVFFRNTTARWEFFQGAPATDLVKANRTLNYLLTQLNGITEFQAASLLVTVLGDEKPLKVGHRRRLNIPNKDGSAYFLSPNAALDAMVEVINLNVRLFLASRRIPEDSFLLTRQGESGVAIVARQGSLAEYRRRRINTFRPREQDLIRMALYVQERAVGRSLRLEDVEFPEIQYREPKLPMSAEDMTSWDMKIRHGVATPIDLLMDSNPEMTEDEARERWEANRKLNAAPAMARAKGVLDKVVGGEEGTA